MRRRHGYLVPDGRNCVRTKFYGRADVTIWDRKVRKQFHGRRQVLFGREGLGLFPSQLCVPATGGAVVQRILRPPNPAHRPLRCWERKMNTATQSRFCC